MANTQTTVPLFVANTVLTAAQQNISAGTGVPVFATTVTRDAAFGGSNKALAEGQLCYIEASNIVQYYDGAAWATVGPSSSSQAVFREEQAAGTYGGTATSGSFATRVLNTTVINNITGCSLATNQVTLAAGTYFVTGVTPAFGGTQATQCRIYNITDSAAIGYGLNNPNGGASSGTLSVVDYYFTLASSKTIALQMRVGTTVGTDGLGSRTNWGNVEVYSQLTITKVA